MMLGTSVSSRYPRLTQTSRMSPWKPRCMSDPIPTNTSSDCKFVKSPRRVTCYVGKSNLKYELPPPIAVFSHSAEKVRCTQDWTSGSPVTSTS